MLKISENAMNAYELKDQFKEHLGEEIVRIRKELVHFC
jgi:hypothetical protein